MVQIPLGVETWGLPSIGILSNSKIFLASSSFLVALSVLVRLIRKPRYVTNLAKVGSRVKDKYSNDEIKAALDVPEYDYIIVGGGTAGCVLASRLSENPFVKVLLLEAGGSGVEQLFSQIPAAFGQFMRSKHDFQLWTVPQPNAGNKSKFWPRPKLLGGCSSVNAMMFHIGVPSDYDEWASVVKGQDGAEKWRFDYFQRYFYKFEKFTPSLKYPHLDASLRGNEGPIQTGYFGSLSKLAESFIASCKRVGISLSHDVNNPLTTTGVTKVFTYIDSKGRRSSTETGYLTPQVLSRRNLTVVIHAPVTRVLFDSGLDSKRAVGVEFARDSGSPKYIARARKEVIISAGAVHTPHILLLSGVGPATQLKKHGISCIQDLPGVGQNLTDHVCLQARFRAKSGETLSALSERTFMAIIKNIFFILQWKLLGTGPLTSNLGEAAGFIRVSDPVLFPPSECSKALLESSSSPNSPDLEIYFTPLGYKSHGSGKIPPGDIVTASALALRPLSKGTLILHSADPFDAPIIDPNYLSHPNDLEILSRGLRLLVRVAKTEPLSSFLIDDPDPELDHNLHESNHQAMEAEVRARVETAYHPACSARMAPLSEGGVVDAKLRVYGLSNLRVVDASAFPTIISGHTAAPVIAMAEFAAAELIRP